MYSKVRSSLRSCFFCLAAFFEPPFWHLRVAFLQSPFPSSRVNQMSLYFRTFSNYLLYYNYLIYFNYPGISQETVFSLVTLFIHSRIAMLRALLVKASEMKKLLRVLNSSQRYCYFPYINQDKKFLPLLYFNMLARWNTTRQFLPIYRNFIIYRI